MSLRTGLLVLAAAAAFGLASPPPAHADDNFPAPSRFVWRRPGCGPGCHVPRRQPAHLHPTEVGRGR